MPPSPRDALPRYSETVEHVVTKGAKARTPGLWEVALGFGRLGLLGFGGVGPHARHVLVEERRWLDDMEYADVLGLGQPLPGANIGNVAAILGDRWAGPLGAVVAVAALNFPPLVIAVVLAAALTRLHGAPLFVAVETAVVAGAAGLVIGQGLRIAATFGPHAYRFAPAALTAALIAVWGFPLPLVLLSMLGLGFVVERRAHRGSDGPR